MRTERCFTGQCFTESLWDGLSRAYLQFAAPVSSNKHRERQRRGARSGSEQCLREGERKHAAKHGCVSQYRMIMYCVKCTQHGSESSLFNGIEFIHIDKDANLNCTTMS